jgi:uncharacterized membrane-anchored protein
MNTRIPACFAVAALALLCVVQWAIPALLIQRNQATLGEGTAYRFRTAPVDPIDPFRGRYVALDFAAARVEVPATRDYEPDARMYAPIEVGEDGYAHLLPPLPQAPVQGDYLVVRIGWRDEAHQLRLELPFDRYYMNEDLAPQAERLYLDRNRMPMSGDDDDPRRPAYVVVRVRGGNAVIEELYIDDLPVRERVLQAR